MAFEKRSRGKLGTPGPFLAEVTNLLDPTYMGRMEVALLKGIPNSVKDQGETYIVSYLSPFYGVTSARYEGNNSSDFNDVQKSYGMWMVPPDVGTTVMVIFIDGDPNQGYWMGCVADDFQNHMVPGIAASKQVAVTPEQRQKYGTDYLPVAEFLTKTQKLTDPNVNNIAKPVHPFADRLLAQGLLLDTTRGVTSSSARREVPSSVFGISTPGPLDTSPGAKRGKIGYEGNRQAPVSRLGGSTFVMDDGDVNGQNELVRIRTRTGHQILLHNSQDLIYIANSKGTAWIEMTSAGKLDIYAADSVSIHTEADFNFRADRDVNIEAGRDINMNAFGGMSINAIDRFYLLCNNDGKITLNGNANITSGGDMRLTSGGTSNFLSGSDMYLNSAATLNQSSGSDWKVSASGTSNIGSSHHIETAGRIDMNGPTAAATAQTGAKAEQPDPFEVFNLPNRSASSGWANGNFFKAGNITTILQRVPTHEPWDQHESVNPQLYTSNGTDIRVSAPADGKTSPTAPPAPTDGSVAPNVNNNPVAVPLSKNAASNEQYLQAVLVNGGVTDPIKLAAWMAQCKVESAGFKALKEYASGAEYEGRTDLGNNQPGDGVRYKGRGFIQLTGRDVYRKMTKYFNAGIDFEAQPELVEELEWAAKSVLYFFNVYKGYRFKDPSYNWDDCVAVTKVVNGGTNGLAQRQAAYAYYKEKFQTNGVVPSGTVGTGAGLVLTDSSGNPVQTGAK